MDFFFRDDGFSADLQYIKAIPDEYFAPQKNIENEDIVPGNDTKDIVPGNDTEEMLPGILEEFIVQEPLTI